MIYRHEWKHEISVSYMITIRQRLGVVAKPDPHAVNGKYFIRSLYFDDLFDTVLREKLNGINKREKFRIRYYNGDASLIHLEKKSKINGLCGKLSAELSVSEARAIASGRIGLFIFLIYKKTFTGVMYSSSFGVTLVILAVTSNVVLSLGMVGALSIVRFRTAIKEPLDIAFLFWSIAAGTVLAAGMIPLAVIGSVIIGVVLLVFVNKKSHANHYILVLQCNDHDSEKRAKAFIEPRVQRLIVKSKTAQRGVVELNLEVRLKDDNTDFVNALSEIEGVHSAALVSYNGDYMG